MEFRSWKLNSFSFPDKFEFKQKQTHFIIIIIALIQFKLNNKR